MDTSAIFHEKQEQGSMLCAQHALNNLIQTSLFSASELANIAHELDQLEAAQLDQDQLQERNQNADETGFFSVAVLEQALAFVNLKLVRWDSADMRPFHPYPEAQSAFIMNLGQHWFTLRKFASNNDFWFNVNSFLPKPERVSKLYLGLQIHEAQREGYSVFAVLPAGDHYDPTEPFLPNCKADDFFTSNAHLAYTGFSGTLQASGSGPQTSTSTSSSSNGSRPRSESFDSLDADRRPARRRRISEEDEDEMLKRAIEASMQEENQRAAVKGKPASSAKAPVQVVEISDDSDDDDDEALSKSLQAGAKLNGASKATTPAPAPDEDDGGFEEDAPTVEELRLKRLARFGAR